MITFKQWIHSTNLTKPGDKTTINILVGFLRDDDINRSMIYVKSA